MKREEKKARPKTNRVATTLVAVVVLCLLTTFGLLYALTPPTVATVEPQYSLKQE